MTTKLIYDLMLSDVAEIIRAHGREDGWEVEESTEDGLEMLDWMLDDDICAQVSLVKHETIHVLSMTVALEDDTATLDDLNAFNSNEHLVSAYMSDENVIIVRAELCIGSVVAAETIETFLDMAAAGVYDIIEDVEDDDYDDEDDGYDDEDDDYDDEDDVYDDEDESKDDVYDDEDESKDE